MPRPLRRVAANADQAIANANRLIAEARGDADKITAAVLLLLSSINQLAKDLAEDLSELIEEAANGTDVEAEFDLLGKTYQVPLRLKIKPRESEHA